MPGKLKFTITLVLVASLFVGAYALYDHLGGTTAAPQLASQAPVPSADPASTPLPKAPDFSVVDAEGRPVNLTDFFGKPIVLNFWASWCGPCKMEMPDFQKAWEQYGSDVHFLMVNLTDGARETVETADRYIDEQGFTFPVYFDTRSSAAITYGVMSIPTTYFINADGVPVAQAAGALNAATLEKGLGMIR